ARGSTRRSWSFGLGIGLRGHVGCRTLYGPNGAYVALGDHTRSTICLFRISVDALSSTETGAHRELRFKDTLPSCCKLQLKPLLGIPSYTSPIPVTLPQQILSPGIAILDCLPKPPN